MSTRHGGRTRTNPGSVACVCAFVFAISLAWLHPAGAQQPARDNPMRQLPETAGTAKVRGRVVDAQTGRPVPRATIMIGGRGANRPSVQTDEQGAFEISGLQAGRYTLNAQKSTYLPGSYPESQRRSIRGPGMLTLADGQTKEDVVISLSHGGAITGRVVDEFGDPVERAFVQLMAVPSRSASQQLRQMAGDSTNDIGEFRIGRLQAGKYYLAVRHAFTQGLLSYGPRVPSGMVGSILGGGPSAEPGQQAGQQLGYVTTYYPGVASLDQATPITIDSGQTMTGVEIPLVQAMKTLVTGTLTSSTGDIGGGRNLQVFQLGPGGQRMSWDMQQASIQPDGAFSILLAPGEYDIVASIYPSQPDAANTGARASRAEYARTHLTVGGEPVANLSIATRRGVSVTGRVVFEGDAPRPAKPSRGFGLQLSTIIGRGDECRSNSAPTMNDDWTFIQEDVWGICAANGSMADSRWQLKAIRVGGTDITNRPVDLTKGEPLRNVEVVYTDRVSSLGFDVTDDAGTATKDYVVLLFPADKTLWSMNGWQLVRAYVPPTDDMPAVGPSGARPGVGAGGAAVGGVISNATIGGMVGTLAPAIVGGVQGGVGPFVGPGRSATMQGLRAADYLVIALDDVAPEDSRDPAFLEAIAPLATPITLSEGEQRTVQLQRQTAPPVDR